MLIVSGARAGTAVRDLALLGAVHGHEHAFRGGRWLALDAVELQEAVLGREGGGASEVHDAVLAERQQGALHREGASRGRRRRGSRAS